MLQEMRKLNLGGGGQSPEKWINVDYAFAARTAKIPFFHVSNSRLKIFSLNWNKTIVLHDLRKRFSWNNEYNDVIHSSHTLEHLTKEEGIFYLGECYRVLKKRGIIRIVVPDFRHLVDDYISGALRSNDFVENLGVLFKSRERGIKGRLAPFIQFPHKCMYDAETLLSIMRQLGFTFDKSQSFCSRIEDIDQVELRDRTENAVS